MKSIGNVKTKFLVTKKDILKFWPPFFRAPVRQGGSYTLGSQSGEKKFSQNVSCYIPLERKFDADHFLRKDLAMKINDFSENLLQSDLNVTLELNLW